MRAAAVGLLIACVLAIAGCAAAPDEPARQAEAGDITLSAGALTIEPASCDFGTVQQIDIRSATLTATNTGTEPVRILALGGT